MRDTKATSRKKKGFSLTAVSPSPEGNTMSFDRTPVTKSVINLDDFSKVTLGKNVEDTWSAISNTTEALAAVGNDSAKFLEIIKEGLRAEKRRLAAEDPNGFVLYKDGELTATPFSGSMGHPKAVNALVLPLAKINGDWSKMTKDEKKAARADAVDTIKSNAKMLNNLKNRSAEMFAAGEEEEADADAGE